MSLLAPFEPRSIDAAQRGWAAQGVAGTSARFDRGRVAPVGAGVPASVDFLVHALLSDTALVTTVIPRLEAMVDELVITWSPSMRTTSRTELVNELLASDNAITDVAARIVHRFVVRSTVFVEWSIRGRFGNVAFLDDDVLVEPSGRTVSADGMMVLSFRGGRAIDIQCHYDPVALAQQALGG